MKDLSLRPGLWTNYTNSQAAIPLLDHKSPLQQSTLLLKPNRLVQYITLPKDINVILNLTKLKAFADNKKKM